MNTETLTKHIQTFIARTQQNARQSIGFPVATDFDYEAVFPLFGHMLNNVGDPYAPSLYSLNSSAMECDVIDYFAGLFRAPADNHWGYITNGGTEGNLYALYVARELLPEATVFYTDAAHYSIPKNTHILRQQTCRVATQSSGEMDYDDFAATLRPYAGKPVIVVATVGTTMTEARDDVSRIRAALAAAGVTRSFIHVDAALAGVYAALLQPRWPFDFAHGADSISLSGHKFIGSPMPCGVVLVKKSDRAAVSRSGMYTGSPDNTISGSRNGHTPVFLWYAIQRWGTDGFRKRAEQGVALAAYAHAQLERIGWKTWRNPDALTVMLAEPPAAVVRAWQLATYDGWSHIICMPGMSRARIDHFIADLAAVPVPPVSS